MSENVQPLAPMGVTSNPQPQQLDYVQVDGRGIPTPIRPYYDQEMEERDVMKVIRAFLRVT